jgi:hypothetical protein
MRHWLLALGFAVVSWVAGCGDSNGGDDDDESSGGAVALGSFGTRTAAYFCKTAFACCTSEERGEGSPATEAECRAAYGSLFALVADEIGESVANGRVRYDGAAYGVCLAQADAAGCTGTEAFDACVGGVITPLVDTGGACQQQSECIDSACIGGDSSANTDGVCGAPQPLGAACSQGEECASGACPFGSCEAKAANGSECFDDDECVSGHCDGNAFVCSADAGAFCN